MYGGGEGEGWDGVGGNKRHEQIKGDVCRRVGVLATAYRGAGKTTTYPARRTPTILSLGRACAECGIYVPEVAEMTVIRNGEASFWR